MLYALELSRVHATLNEPGVDTSDQFRKIQRRGTRKRAQGPQSLVPTMTELAEKLLEDFPGLHRGSEFPCRGGLRIECSDCNGVFVSRECYERHQGRMFARFHVCKKSATERLSPNKKHECGQRFCSRRCTCHRAEQPCYILPVNPKARDHPYEH